MAHRTFFSFHYERDVQRAAVVRNSSKLKPSITPEWIEASIWGSAKATGDAALQRLIDAALVGTTVTAVLIGAQTGSRRWVKYEIDKSIGRGNGLIGIPHPQHQGLGREQRVEGDEPRFRPATRPTTG
jgi:hypothetical protein